MTDHNAIIEAAYESGVRQCYETLASNLAGSSDKAGDDRAIAAYKACLAVNQKARDAALDAAPDDKIKAQFQAVNENQKSRDKWQRMYVKGASQ